MIRKHQKKLIEVLDEYSLIDKEKKIGCIVEVFGKGHIRIGKCGKDYYGSHMMTPEALIKGYHVAYKRDNGLIGNYERKEIRYMNVVGQYYLSSIQNLLYKLGIDFIRGSNNTLIATFGRGMIVLDTIVPPMEREDSLNEELLLFIKDAINEKE